MAEVAPFRAFRYNPARVDVSKLVTQPYDKITPEMQERYYAAGPYNLVRIILGKREPTDQPGENVYTRAANCFQDWRRENVLLQDGQPSIYRYVQRFAPPGGGAEMQRQGFIAIGKIEDYASGVIFRHEQTLARPKADRLELLRATRAHFGQIFMLYSDPGEIDGLLQQSRPPDTDLHDEYGVMHRVWKISDPRLIERLCGKMQDKKLIIADGHHRYETALTYRDERRAMSAAAFAGTALADYSQRGGTSAKSSSHEWVMMTFINMDSPGLLILPTHRVVHGLSSFSAHSFRDAASTYFGVEEVDPAINASRASGILREAGHVGTAILAVTKDRAFLLDRPKATVSNLLTDFSLRQQALDVVQLHKCLLETVLEISEDAIREQRNLSYVRDAGEALGRVREGSANVAFLMNPVRMRQVRDIAFAGEVLPQKSTDFYPKLLSGLAIYGLE
jgi:uncharacterized protein (DUF1015 family)